MTPKKGRERQEDRERKLYRIKMEHEEKGRRSVYSEAYTLLDSITSAKPMLNDDDWEIISVSLAAVIEEGGAL